MQNPVPASQLANQDYMKCALPDVGKEICNGLENITIANNLVSGNLLNSCNFNTANWHTCYNCPASEPTLQNPTPNNAVATTDPKYRHPVPKDCDSIWWDPVAGQCLCTTTACAYKDESVPISSTNSTTNNTSSSTNSTSGKPSTDKSSATTNIAFGLTTSLGMGVAAAAAAMMLM
jgi:hypothetical protein